MSGSRLPGDDGTTNYSADKLRVDTRLDGQLRRRFTDYLETSDRDKTEIVRDALADYLPNGEPTNYVVPRNPDLRDAYLQLADDHKRVMPIDRAVDILSQTTHSQTAKQLIKAEVIGELDGSGLVNVVAGKVGIHPLTPRDQVSGPAATSTGGP